jgi:hypothetical protein
MEMERGRSTYDSSPSVKDLAASVVVGWSESLQWAAHKTHFGRFDRPRAQTTIHAMAPPILSG